MTVFQKVLPRPENFNQKPAAAQRAENRGTGSSNALGSPHQKGSCGRHYSPARSRKSRKRYKGSSTRTPKGWKWRMFLVSAAKPMHLCHGCNGHVPGPRLVRPHIIKNLRCYGRNAYRTATVSAHRDIRCCPTIPSMPWPWLPPLPIRPLQYRPQSPQL